MKRNMFGLIIGASLLMVSCGQKESSSETTTIAKEKVGTVREAAPKEAKIVIEGNYQRVKKVDMADQSETVYEKGSGPAKVGYGIKKAGDDKYIVSFIDIDEAGEVTPSSYNKTMEINKVEDVYQATNKSGGVLTFYFESDGLKIAEFNRDGSGNMQHESDLYFTKLK